MRAALIASIAAVAACGNGMIQIDQIVPFQGTLNSTVWQDQEIGSEWTVEGATHEVDVSEGFCVSIAASSEGLCFQETLIPHYAAVLVSNHNEEPDFGVAGTAELTGYSVDYVGRKTGDAPAVTQGITGRLGVSIRPQRTKAFPIILVGLDTKEEFRDNMTSETTGGAYPYNVKVTIKGEGVSIDAATTVMMGDFINCGEEALGTSYCNPF